MSAPPPTTSEHQPSLEHLLLRFGLVTLDQLSLALREQTEIGTPFAESLVRDGIVSADDLARVADRAPALEPPVSAAAPALPAIPFEEPSFAPAPSFEGEPPAEPFAAAETPFATTAAPETEDERPTVRFTTVPPVDYEQPAHEPTAPEQPAHEQPADEQPAHEQPGPEPPTDEQPADEQPAHEPPAPEPPVSTFPADEPVVEPPTWSFEAPAATEPPVVEAAPPAPEPPAVVEAPAPTPVATGFVVRGHLVNGEDVEIAAVDDAAEAQQIARDAMRACARTDGSDWPILNGRYVRPESIVSIEVAERG